jgi:hypothetical protein
VDRPSRSTTIGSLAVAVIGLSAFQLLADVGPLHDLECMVRTRNGLIFELPDNGVTLDEFRHSVADDTDGCGTVVVREGSLEGTSTVISGGSGRGGLAAGGDRNIYVRTVGPGRQAPPPPTTESAPQP